MNRERLDLIPSHLLKPDSRRGCADLIDWLRGRGWTLSLHELDAERRARGLLPPTPDGSR